MACCTSLPPQPLGGKVTPDILLNGLGPVGNHIIPRDIWDRTVPHEFVGAGG